MPLMALGLPVGCGGCGGLAWVGRVGCGGLAWVGRVGCGGLVVVVTVVIAVIVGRYLPRSVSSTVGIYHGRLPSMVGILHGRLLSQSVALTVNIYSYKS
jgi:hypothetical protein